MEVLGDVTNRFYSDSQYNQPRHLKFNTEYFHSSIGVRLCDSKFRLFDSFGRLDAKYAGSGSVKISALQQNWAIAPDFTHHAHSASLSAVAVNERYVVTGSKDETIQIYDMKKKVEHGALVHHNGTVSCLEFYGSAHLLSGAEDGLMCIWNTKKWECLKSIKAHKGHVTSLSIHPSGKLALSVGTDRTLRTWNLVEGRSAFIKNIKQNAHLVKWSPSGETYMVAIANKVDLYKLETASISGTIVTEKRISSVRFITDSILAIAGDDEFIRLFDCESQKCLCEFKAHENRIKALYSFKMEGLHILVTASSDGYIKVWNLDIDKIENTPSLLCEVNTKARLTCLAVWLKRDFETEQISSEATTSSCQVHEADQPSVKKRKFVGPIVINLQREMAKKPL